MSYFVAAPFILFARFFYFFFVKFDAEHLLGLVCVFPFLTPSKACDVLMLFFFYVSFQVFSFFSMFRRLNSRTAQSKRAQCQMRYMCLHIISIFIMFFHTSFSKKKWINTRICPKHFLWMFQLAVCIIVCVSVTFLFSLSWKQSKNRSVFYGTWSHFHNSFRFKWNICRLCVVTLCLKWTFRPFFSIH